MSGLFSADAFESERPVERDPETGLFYRPDSVDLTIIRGDCRGYPRRLPPRPGDRVLDVGAHIGGATRALLDAGAGYAVAVEPDPANFALLARNVEGLPATAVRGAVVGDDRPEVAFFRGSLNGTSMGSLIGRAGRGKKGKSMVTVPAVRFGALLEEHAVSYVKLDCEGAEYDLLGAGPLPESVRRLVVEFHANSGALVPRIPGTLASLDEQGFVPDRKDPGRPTKSAWVWTVAYER
jgi:FkbM family methyltransferase